MIGVASFPIITDTKECESITVPLDYDVNQKTDNENSKIEIINSPLEKDGFWKVIRCLRIITPFEVAIFAIFLKKFKVLIFLTSISNTAAT